MITRRGVLAGASALAIAAPARAQGYPDKIIKLVVPFPAGGPVDVMARLVGQQLTASLGQPVIIDNRPGAGGTIAAKAVSVAEPDGYTLFFGSAGSLAISPSLYKNLGYDPNGFAPVALIANHPLALALHPSVPARTVADLIAYAKANPGKLNFGSVPGTPPHLLGELFRMQAGINIVIVPYKGAAQALVDLIAGQVQVTMLSTTVIVQPIQSGQLRGLAVTSAARWPELPDIPTFAELGFPNLPRGSWTGMVAPSGTPPDRIAKLNAAINTGLRSDALRDGLIKLGAEISTPSPGEFGALWAADEKAWAAAVALSGAKLE